MPPFRASALRPFAKSLLDLFFPRYCCVCGRRLMWAEPHTCIACLSHLPLTHIEGERGNVVERLIYDEKFSPCRAASLLYYAPHSPSSLIFLQFKYFHNPSVAVSYGRLMAGALWPSGFFRGIDLLVPVPLAPARQHKRGYNQSERLAHGVGEVTGLPVDNTSLVRTVDNPSQTQLQPEARRKNVEGIFRLVSPERVAGKHILLIDDVITTGSTACACARALQTAPGVSVSVLSLGLTAGVEGNVPPEG